MPKNDPESFFKYYSPETGKAVLASGKLKWSSPKLFNDPFDGQIDLLLDPDEEALANEIYNAFMHDMMSPVPIESYISLQMNALINFLRETRQRSGIEFDVKHIRSLRLAAIEGARRAIASFPTVNHQVKQLNLDMCMFCVSEVRDSIEMWGYYAKDHTGIVFEFLPYVGDSPFSVAKPVNYLPTIPRISGAELVKSRDLPMLTLDRISLTKSQKWSHEQEWRIVSTMRDKTKDFELLPFNRNELGSIIFGARISPDNRNEIIELAKRNFPFAKLYQAVLSKTDFSMALEEIPTQAVYTIDPFKSQDRPRHRLHTFPVRLPSKRR